MSTIHLRHTDPDPAEQIHRTLGCEFRAGRCVTHQRAMDQWRPGCPVTDTILRTSKGHRR